MANRPAEAPQWINTGNTDSDDSDPVNSDSDADLMNASSDGDEPDNGLDMGSTDQVAFSVHVLMIPLLFFSRAWGHRSHLRKSKTNILDPSHWMSTRDGGRCATISHWARVVV